MVVSIGENKRKTSARRSRYSHFQRRLYSPSSSFFSGFFPGRRRSRGKGIGPMTPPINHRLMSLLSMLTSCCTPSPHSFTEIGLARLLPLFPPHIEFFVSPLLPSPIQFPMLTQSFPCLGKGPLHLVASSCQSHMRSQHLPYFMHR